MNSHSSQSFMEGTCSMAINVSVFHPYNVIDTCADIVKSCGLG